LVFIDETGLNTKLARHHGRCPLGQRCFSAIPHGHWQSSTFIAALRHESIAAPFLIEGPVDAEVFTAYLEQVLCPNCARATPSSSTTSPPTKFKTSAGCSRPK
jgi:DDE superfamily endonuclease